MMGNKIFSALSSLFICTIIGVMSLGTIQKADAQDNVPKLFQNLEFRSVGPAVTGGRIHDVEALPSDPSTVYVATASGGLWKTTNKGTTWEAIFDDQPVSTFGDVAIAPSDTDIIYAGTGEQNNRQSTSWGNGVYRSDDGGKTWKHLGLDETRHIGKVIVHPKNPDIVWVAALGNLWMGTEERGVYKTTDGGESWDRVLYVDEFTGVVDMEIDPVNPDILYAATYQRLRRTWGFNGGGPGSGIYKSTDGGSSWEELTNGIPGDDKGRIGLAVAQSNPQVLYATIEHREEEGTYRSGDAGASWEKVNDLNPRPMYYSHIYVDPKNADRVYILSTEFYMSEDGGEVFRQMPTRPTYDVGVHSDHHTLWIDPTDTEHFYLAGDAGLHETWDRGETYRRINNIPIGQFYAIGLDNRNPYYIYGGMQDNHSWMGPNETRRWIGIINDDWSQIGFGDGMYQQPDPGNYRFVYNASQNGGIRRLDPKTGDLLDIEPVPPGDEDYRFDWVTPILVSNHDPTTVYIGGNRLFISHDQGDSWQRTKDLSRNRDRSELELMGVPGSEDMLSKHDGTSSYGEITTIAESPLNPDILWVGTDDGNIQVSRDGGKTWNEVASNIDGVRYGTYISRVTASGAGEGVAYAALDAHRDGDFAPYVFKTTDFGQSWENISGGLPEEGSVNEIIEHPRSENLLFLGTEHHLYISLDAGHTWLEFGSNLPTTLYDDMSIHERENDLVVGTHGRSIWILDDLKPLEEWSGEIEDREAHLFGMQPVEIFQYWKSTSYRSQESYAGENPKQGALIHYYLSGEIDSVTVEIRNSEGRLVRSLKGSGEPGTIHRIHWDLRHTLPPRPQGGGDFEREGLVESEKILPELPRSLGPYGSFVSPGVYSVTLRAGDERMTKSIRVKPDPEMPLNDQQWHKREQFLLDLLDMQKEIWDAAERVNALLQDYESVQEKLQEEREGELPSDFKTRFDSLDSFGDRIGAQSRYSGLRDDIYDLAGSFNRSGVQQVSLYPPTGTHEKQFEELRKRFSQVMVEFRREMPQAEQVLEQYQD